SNPYQRGPTLSHSRKMNGSKLSTKYASIPANLRCHSERKPAATVVRIGCAQSGVKLIDATRTGKDGDSRLRLDVPQPSPVERRLVAETSSDFSIPRLTIVTNPG